MLNFLTFPFILIISPSTGRTSSPSAAETTVQPTGVIICVLSISVQDECTCLPWVSQGKGSRVSGYRNYALQYASLFSAMHYILHHLQILCVVAAAYQEEPTKKADILSSYIQRGIFCSLPQGQKIIYSGVSAKTRKIFEVRLLNITAELSGMPFLLSFYFAGGWSVLQ